MNESLLQDGQHRDLSMDPEVAARLIELADVRVGVEHARQRLRDVLMPIVKRVRSGKKLKLGQRDILEQTARDFELPFVRLLDRIRCSDPAALLDEWVERVAKRAGPPVTDPMSRQPMLRPRPLLPPRV